jgi:DNA polymerase III delta subunit
MAVQKKEDGAFRKLKEDLAQENPAQFYVFYGEEDYLRQFYLKELRRICGGPFDAFDTIVLDAEQVNADTLTDAIDSFPMGSERK